MLEWMRAVPVVRQQRGVDGGAAEALQPGPTGKGAMKGAAVRTGVGGGGASAGRRAPVFAFGGLRSVERALAWAGVVGIVDVASLPAGEA